MGKTGGRVSFNTLAKNFVQFNRRRLRPRSIGAASVAFQIIRRVQSFKLRPKDVIEQRHYLLHVSIESDMRLSGIKIRNFRSIEIVDIPTASRSIQSD